MNQKRILSLALAAAMALSLTACGSKSDSSSSADDTPTGVAVQDSRHCRHHLYGEQGLRQGRL